MPDSLLVDRLVATDERASATGLPALISEPAAESASEPNIRTPPKSQP